MDIKFLNFLKDERRKIFVPIRLFEAFSAHFRLNNRIGTKISGLGLNCFQNVNTTCFESFTLVTFSEVILPVYYLVLL
jgi:hypothetical protein